MGDALSRGQEDREMHDLDTPVPQLTAEELALMEQRFEKLDAGRRELRRKLNDLELQLDEARALLNQLQSGPLAGAVAHERYIRLFALLNR
jgi:chromosome segregation ATPase